MLISIQETLTQFHICTIQEKKICQNEAKSF